LRPGIGGNYWTDFFPPVALLGLGMAVSVAPLTTVVMSSVPSNRSGIASGVNNAVARTAGLVAIAVLGIVMLQIFKTELDRQMTNSKLPPTVVDSILAQSTKLVAIAMPENQDAATQQLIRRAIDESFVSGFRMVIAIGATLAVGAAAMAMTLIRGAK